MKRAHKRILSAALAAALMLCSVSQNTPFRLWNPPTAVQAAGKVTLNEETGVLTLSGEVTKEQIWAFRENQKVTNIVAAEGTVLPIDCTGLFARMNCEVHTLDPDGKRYVIHDVFWFGNVTAIDLSEADTSQVKNMKYMFSANTESYLIDYNDYDGNDYSDIVLYNVDWEPDQLTTLNLDSIDTSNVENMACMFIGCSKLSALDLTDFDTAKVLDMSQMFSNCSDLKTIYVSAMWKNGSVASSDNMFALCNSLTGGASTVYNSNKTDVTYACIDNPPDHPGYFTSYEYRTSGKCGKDLTWKYDAASKTLTIEGTGAMYDYEMTYTPWYEYVKNIKNLKLPDGLTYIGEYAFFECSFSSAEIPETVQKFGNSAFHSCRYLSTINLPEQVMEIPNSLFCDCGFQSFTVPNHITNVGSGAFSRCKNMTDIYIMGVNTKIDEDDDTLNDWSTLIHGYPASDAQIYAGMNNRKFKFITDGKTSGKCGDNLTWKYDAETQTLTIEGSGAMYNWEVFLYQKSGNILEYEGTAYEDTICEYTEEDYTTAAPWEDYKDSIKKIELPEGITTISPYSFCYCSKLEEIVLPESLAALGKCAFYACSELKHVVVLNPEMDFDPDNDKDDFNCWIITNKPFRDVTYDKYGDSYYMTLEYPLYPNSIYGYPDSTAQAFYKQYKENGGSNQPPKFVPLRKVFFDANGGSGEMSSIRFGYPADLKTVTLPECSFTAPKKGMAFSGWQVLSETKQPGDEIAPTEDLTVKAIWDDTLLTVSFDANGGTGEQAAITATAEEGFYLPACTFTAPEGQDFSGWQISGNTEKTYAPGDLFKIDSDITLVPVWAKTTCAVTFDANGGTGEMDCKTVSVDAEFTFPKCRFIAPEGKEFSAWMIGEIAYEIGDTVTISEDTVIKAVWTDKANTDPVVPISDKKLGDLDGNTKIDVKDAMLLAHYVAKWDGVELDLDACDLNADSTVDQADAMILARYVAGWDGYDKYFESKPI